MWVYFCERDCLKSRFPGKNVRIGKGLQSISTKWSKVLIMIWLNLDISLFVTDLIYLRSVAIRDGLLFFVWL